MADNRAHAVVIGSGFGGLAAAVRLGAQGYRVTVLERRDKPGGRAYVAEQDGFVFDTGPTVITAPQLFEELFELCGKRMSDHVTLKSVDPFYRVRFDDGHVFNYSGDHNTMMAQIAALAPEDVKGYEAFLEMSQKIFHVGFERLADVPFDTWWSMARIAPEMIRLKSHKTVHGLISSYIGNDKLRQILGFHTLLVGGNPFNTTSIYALIAFLEQKWGVHFPVGGMGALVDALVDLIVGQGNRVRFDSEVTEIITQGRVVSGVRLASQETISADLVVSNADAAWTYRHLLPESKRRHWTNKRLDKLDYSMGLFVWYFGTKRVYNDVVHHTILMGPRYRELLDDIFSHQRLADDFSLYLHRPTATDPALAPAGHDAFYVLSPVPHLGAGIDWSVAAEPYRQAIARHLSRTELPGLEQSLVTSKVITPEHFRSELLSVNGAGFAMQPTLLQSAYFRPHNKSEDVEGLFLVGAGTHPGAGLPGVLSSARILDKVIPHAYDRVS